MTTSFQARDWRRFSADIEVLQLPAVRPIRSLLLVVPVGRRRMPDDPGATDTATMLSARAGQLVLDPGLVSGILVA